jgi:hypothetical protein
MAEQQLILIALLLTAAVMYGYYYFKRAQARTAGKAQTPSVTDASRDEPAPKA